MKKPSVAIVGIGVAGLTAAWKLQHHCDVSLFEKNAYIGGHTRTLTLKEGPDAGTPIDTGFIVMNHRNYPHFTRLLEEWNVDLQDSDMSFSYQQESTGYEYAGTGLRGIFPKPSLLLDASHWKLLRELKRFGRVGTEALRSGQAAQMTLGGFLETHQFAKVFQEKYLYPMGAAIWSSPPDSLADFPAEPYLHFFENHGLLTLKNRPTWRVVKGGSQSYVTKALSALNATVHTACSPEKIYRNAEGVSLCFPDGEEKRFDHVVMGTHADQSLALLGDADAEEQQLLDAWSYQPNEVVLHWDESVMPRSKACWASWNFSNERGIQGQAPVSVSYWMNRLQNLKTQRNYFVSLNRASEIPSEKIIDRTVLHHPFYNQNAIASQAGLRKINGHRNTWRVGSYFGYGFHEDAVRSAVEMSDVFLEHLKHQA